MVKENNVLSVLLYLFHCRAVEDSADGMGADLASHLEEVGFAPITVHKALSWLAAFSDQQVDFAEMSEHSFRVFSEEEIVILDREARGFLLDLEQRKILNAQNRERVIQQLCLLDQDAVELSLVKWVVLLVLFHQSEYAKGTECMQLLALDDWMREMH